MKNQVAQYNFQVAWSAEDEEHVATCLEFPSLSWLAKTPQDAISGLADLISEVITDLEASGEKVPQPYSLRQYSGKFNLRIGTKLHQHLAQSAAREGLSLNQYILRRLSQIESVAS